jgi:hypothetical protein
MRGICCRLAAGLLLIGIAAGAAPAQTQTRAPAKPTAVRELQRALRDHDRAWVADHIHYPMRYFGRIVAVIRNRGEFLRNYDTIVSDRLRGAVLMQDPERVFENWQGLMVGDGSHNMWLRENGEGDRARYEIVTINDSR